MKKVLVKNSLFGVGQSLINILLIFFVIPIFIRMLGSESYSVFALVMVIGNLNTFSNLGLTNALVKFIAEQGKSEESNIDIIVNLILIISAIIPLTIIVGYFNRFILISLLKVPLNIFNEAKLLFFWVLWANLVLLIGQVFKSILDGMQKVYITSLQQGIYNILYWGLILFALLSGSNLSTIGMAIFVSAVIWLIITIISVSKIWGKLSFLNLRKNFKVVAKKQLGYGLKLYTEGLINFFYEPLSKILVSNFIGITEVGFYDIALKLKSALWGIIAKIFYPLFPFISEQKDKAIIRKYVNDLEQKTFLVIVPVISIVILLMHPLIRIWLNKNVDIISITGIFIISSHLIGSSTIIPNYQFLMAKNLVEKNIILQLSNVVFNILFFFTSVYFVGYYAIIIGNTGAILGSFIISLYYQKKYLDSMIFDNFVDVMKIILTSIILVLTGFIIKMVIGNNHFLIIVVLSLVIFSITPLLYRILRLVRPDDIHRYFGSNNKIAKKLAHFYNT
jgi:O-antigen/teichoic acid export membrane protein